ncbi:hypothetical protein [Halalkalicoccus jeotgali]|uniref:hypothetical protein n=1 Tax=Halalkalicoccus jeotgali TaxID=413810 RepID=UPI000677634F|nr:hypothetical protein [Halalkalicoccus jeotgali]
MASRENRLTVVSIIIALPTAYLSRALLDSVNVGEQTGFMVSFFVLIGVGVFLPQFLNRRLN